MRPSLDDPLYLRELLDSTSDVETVTDSTGHLLYISPACMHVFGVSDADIMRDTAAFFMRVHADDRDLLRKHRDVEIREQAPGMLRYRLQHADGRVRWIEHRCGPLYAPTGEYIGQRGSSRDVTDLVMMEERTRLRLAAMEMLTRISSLLVALPFYEADRGLMEVLQIIGETTRADRCFIGLFGTRPDAFGVERMWMRPGLDAVVPPPSDDERRNLLPWSCRTLRRGECIVLGTIDDLPPEATEERVVLTMLETRSICIAPLRHGDTVVGGLALSVYDAPLTWTEDIVDYLRLAADLISGLRMRSEQSSVIVRQNEELRHMVDALMVTSRVKDDFLTTMSHELRTPLTSIIGLTEVLQMNPGTMSDRQRHFIDVIGTSGQRLHELIEDIFDVADLEAGSSQLDLSAVRVADAVHAATRVVRLRAQQKHHSLAVEIEPDTLVIDADGRRLRQMLVNLLTNAVTFTPERGAIDVRARVDDDEAFVRIEVRDTGIGIAAGDIPQLFQPFGRLDTTLTRRTGGSGLGLVITRRLVELHGGTISVESTPGSGSTFTLRLPRTH